MIIQNPMEFFKIPEHVVIINIVDIVNRFTTMIEEYVVEMEPAYITTSGAMVIIKKSDKLLDSKGQSPVYFSHHPVLAWPKSWLFLRLFDRFFVVVAIKRTSIP